MNPDPTLIATALWLIFSLLCSLLAFKAGYSLGYHKGFSDSVRHTLRFQKAKESELDRNGLN